MNGIFVEKLLCQRHPLCQRHRRPPGGAARPSPPLLQKLWPLCCCIDGCVIVILDPTIKFTFLGYFPAFAALTPPFVRKLLLAPRHSLFLNLKYLPHRCPDIFLPSYPGIQNLSPNFIILLRLGILQSVDNRSRLLPILCYQNGHMTSNLLE